MSVSYRRWTAGWLLVSFSCYPHPSGIESDIDSISVNALGKLPAAKILKHLSVRRKLRRSGDYLGPGYRRFIVRYLLKSPTDTSLLIHPTQRALNGACLVSTNLSMT